MIRHKTGQRIFQTKIVVKLGELRAMAFGQAQTLRKAHEQAVWNILLELEREGMPVFDIDME